MPRRAQNSACRDPENRSKKFCACGGHSRKARKKRKPRRESIRFKENCGNRFAVDADDTVFAAFFTTWNPFRTYR